MTRYTVLVSIGLALLTTHASAANRPNGYVTICNEGKTCSVPTTINVAFGRADKFFYRSLSGSFVCNEATFGARIAGGVNECSIAKGWHSSSSSSSSSSSGGITGASCVSAGVVNVSSVIEVSAGSVFDGGCKTFRAAAGFGNDRPQSEIDAPQMFNLRDGATLKNVIIDGGDNVGGIVGAHISGNATVDNVALTNHIETAFKTRLQSGTVTVRNLSATTTSYATFVALYPDTHLIVSNAVVGNAGGQFFRQNGGTTYKTTVTCDRCSIGRATTAVFRGDSPVSTASLTNSRIPAALPLCSAGYTAANCTSSNLTRF